MLDSNHPIYLPKPKCKQHWGHSSTDLLKDKLRQTVFKKKQNFNFVYLFSSPVGCQLPFSWANNIDIWCQFLFITAPKRCKSQIFQMFLWWPNKARDVWLYLTDRNKKRTEYKIKNLSALIVIYVFKVFTSLHKLKATYLQRLPSHIKRVQL